MEPKVERLRINFKTLEEFKKFHENGLEELSMYDELQENLIEDPIQSPFYGIYKEGKLIARMKIGRAHV